MNYQTMYRKDGMSDADRLNTALTATSLKIHDMSMIKLLSYSAQVGQYLKYVNNDNNVDGTWNDIFTSDELGIIADITIYNCNNYLMDIMYQLRIPGIATAVIKKCINKIFIIINKIDRWVKLLSQLDRHDARLFLTQIHQLIESDFSRQYHVLLSIVEKIAGENQKVSIPELYGPWKKIVYTKVDLCNDDEIQGKLCTILYALHGVVSTIKRYAEMFYNDSMSRSDHSPETALFITFLELFQNIQKQINTIPEKYVLYYYENILKYSRNDAVSDTIYVTLSGNKNDEIIIPQETEFIADEGGKEILYVNNTATVVKPASVASVCSIFLEKNRYKEPEKSLDFYSKIRALENSQIEAAGNCNRLFSSGKTSEECATRINSNMGFAIASKIFYLSEGERKIKCTFTISDDLNKSWDVVVKNHLDSKDKIGDENIWRHEFIKIFKSLFVIEMTTESGWYTIEKYQPNSSVIDPECSKNSVQFEFTIPVSAPPIVSYDKMVHGYSFSSNLPICKMTFNDSAEIFPYSLIKNVITEEVQIDISVKGATGLLLYNQYGQIDSSNKFLPFGPIPGKGESFIIGYHELADKSVNSIDLEFEWGNLPWQQNGFAEIYEGYSYHFNNNSFKIKVSELRDGVWVDSDDEEKRSVILYETENSNTDSRNGIGPVQPYKRIQNIKVSNFREKLISNVNKDYQYTSKTKNRFLKVTLTAPDCGFGQSIFAHDLSSAFINKMHNKNGGQIPGQPYYPVVNKLVMNYQAKTVLKFSKSDSVLAQSDLNDSFYHIVPFGSQKMCPGAGCSNITFVPEIDRVDNQSQLADNLFIGIKGGNIAGEMSLFFKMDEDRVTACCKKVKWFFLSNNKWIAIDQKKIIADTTCDMSSTGIVTLIIPKAITSNNTVMPSGLYWIRGAIDSSPGSFENIFTIDVNGIQLVRKKIQGTLPEYDKANAGFCIKGFMKQVAGIDGVIQHTVPTGGISKETTHAFMTRVSETLRHKNRLVTTKDYEQVILENFKEIYKVKCFKNIHNSDPVKSSPGHIVICVIPALKLKDTVEYQCPKVPVHILHTIEMYLKKYASPMISLDVINPVYELIQIRCSIEAGNSAKKGNIVDIVNKEISDYISPWNSKGNSICFGWRIVFSEIKQCITEIAGVKRVTNFSLLHKRSPESDKYILADTAEESLSGNTKKSIESKLPWSICVPFRQHVIEIIETDDYGKGKITGISKMEIGNVFIVKGKNHGGTEQRNT